MDKRVFSYFLFNKVKIADFKLCFEQIFSLYSNLKNIKDIVNRDFTIYFYKIFPFSFGVHFMFWISFDFEDENIIDTINDEIFKVYLVNSYWFELVDVLWGFTKPSVYSKASKSFQEIDPFSSNRKKFLTVYPFVKTPEWYLLKQDTRQGMMNEHIRIGRQYPEILQLLLYCFGLSNNEFVVVYEMDSIVLFEKLVYELRQSDVRKYTLRDTPIYTAIFQNIENYKI